MLELSRRPRRGQALLRLVVRALAHGPNVHLPSNVDDGLSNTQTNDASDPASPLPLLDEVELVE